MYDHFVYKIITYCHIWLIIKPRIKTNLIYLLLSFWTQEQSTLFWVYQLVLILSSKFHHISHWIKYKNNINNLYFSTIYINIYIRVYAQSV